MNPPPSVETVEIPATIETEFALLTTLVKRMKRQEVREMPTERWNDYVRGIGKLMASGMYAKLNSLHVWYYSGRRIHYNPRFFLPMASCISSHLR